ncbi:MAG: endolytic transglycosylase MltG [Candidatus Omnitrophota bacterium]
MTKTVLKTFAAITFLVMVILSLMIFVPSHEEIKTVRITRQTSLRQISEKLAQKELLRSPFLFIVITKISGHERNLKAGLYEIPANGSPYQVFQKLASGKTAVVRITVPEGWSSREIAKLLERKDLCSRESFLTVVAQKSLEGFLFPNTYFIPSELSPEAITRIFVKEFKNIWKPEWSERAKQIRFTQKEILTLASIIERETTLDEEKPIISSVFHHRLRRGMRLEADPTVLYAIQSWRIPLTSRLLHTVSPYNTYLHRGLPPGPICNPGMKSIMAALYPAKTNYLFFVADGNGTHIFSQTLAEHNSARNMVKAQKNRSI